MGSAAMVGSLRYCEVFLRFWSLSLLYITQILRQHSRGHTDDVILAGDETIRI